MGIPVDFRLGDLVDLDELSSVCTSAEQGPYAGLQAIEARHDPLVQLTVASTATSQIRLTSAVVVAFARNPMSTAISAADLASLSRGRFVLGLGSQIRPHIERRFGMPWSRPAQRMEEFVDAVRAIWRCWETGDALDFRGEFYRHTLMNSTFRREMPFGSPKISVAAVGPAMTRVAGRVGDGLLVHPFTTRRYLSEVLLPRAFEARRASIRADEPYEVSGGILIATGSSDETFEASVHALRRQIAFHGSTPAYRPVLALHGWEALGEELHRLSKTDDSRRWDVMTALIDDEVLTTIGVVAAERELAHALRERVDGVWNRVALYPCTPVSATSMADVVTALREST
ncbi:TIGR03617 family F420-dependent LLM class oxidoreductase [Rhodococcoides fascians]|uniref:TIGR03617 family F420-dependent LLM class oxidoreductase n=1 Tax=Rhodococcoides fascians TaxID=1828 RepID=UPI0024BB0A54|nr:TIGR03617 family F420-dependent LLM class oxidoreductase [Rhodococcus fascians]MDJ0408958.1 TIGR03617 family F420-dependent LLM class oxidoreductase [Rhodococcus fascians]